MKRHLLVTNDFPPKVGGIQNYLWDLWRRLDPASYVVLTASSHEAAAAFDAEQAERGVHIERVPAPILFFPTPARWPRCAGARGSTRSTWCCSIPCCHSGSSAPTSTSPTA